MVACADDAAREAFLAETRLAILITARRDGPPMGVPVWYEWSGGAVRMFAAADSAKLKRLARDPQCSVLVTNAVGEAEAWVAFDGRIEIEDGDVTGLVARLGERYWDMNDPERRATLDAWIAAKDAFVGLRLVPDRIRSGQ